MRPKKKHHALENKAARSAKQSKSRARPKRLSRKTSVAVLNTAELLEIILINLEFHDLIRSQRVSTLWRDTIARSTTIKQKLFLSPDEIKDRWAIVGKTYSDLHFIQITPSTTLPPPVRITYIPWRESVPSPQETTPVCLSPLLKQERQEYSEQHGSVKAISLAQNALFTQTTYCRLLRNLHGPLDGATWRSMHLCKPPCTSLKAKITFKVSLMPVRSTTVHVEIDEPSGITFGLLIDRAMAAPLTNKDGKKCAGDRGSVAEYIRDGNNRQRAYVQAKNVLGSDGTFLQMKGVVAPSDEEWEEVARSARQVE
jgi:hypothetical protein